MLLMKDREALKIRKAFAEAQLEELESTFKDYDQYIDSMAEYYEKEYGNRGEDYDLAMTGVFKDADRIFDYEYRLNLYSDLKEELKEINNLLRNKQLKTEKTRRWTKWQREQYCCY